MKMKKEALNIALEDTSMKFQTDAVKALHFNVVYRQAIETILIDRMALCKIRELVYKMDTEDTDDVSLSLMLIRDLLRESLSYGSLVFTGLDTQGNPFSINHLEELLSFLQVSFKNYKQLGLKPNSETPNTEE